MTEPEYDPVATEAVRQATADLRAAMEAALPWTPYEVRGLIGFGDPSQWPEFRERST